MTSVVRADLGSASWAVVIGFGACLCSEHSSGGNQRRFLRPTDRSQAILISIC